MSTPTFRAARYWNRKYSYRPEYELVASAPLGGI
jgi:hypothetical protein